MGQFDDLIPAKRRKAEPAAPAAGRPSSQFADLVPGAKTSPQRAEAPSPAPPAVAGAAKPSLLERSGIPRALEFIDRPRQTVQAAIAGDRPLNTFLHGADREQQDKNRATVREKWHMPGADERAQGRGLRGGLDDFLVDTATDPTMVLGGPIIRGGVKVAGELGRAGFSALEKLKPEFAKDVTGAAHAVQDFFTVGGSAKRELGEPVFNAARAGLRRQKAKGGRAGEILADRFEEIPSSLSHDEAVEVGRFLNGERQFTDPVSGRLLVAPHVAEAGKALRTLTNDAAAINSDPTALRKLAYGGGKLATNVKKRPPAALTSMEQLLAKMKSPEERQQYLTKLTPEERGAYLKQQAEKLFAPEPSGGPAGRLLQTGGRPIFKPRGETNRKLLGRVERQYIPPDNLKPFQAPPDQALFGSKNIRSNYLPNSSKLAEEVNPDRPARTVSDLQPFAPNLIQRDSFTMGDRPEDVARMLDSFRGAMKQAARQSTTSRMRDELGVPLKPVLGDIEDTALDKLFTRTTRAKGASRTQGEKASDAWRAIVDIPKNTVSTMGGKHGLVNVPALAAGSEGPGAALEGLSNGARILGITPKGLTPQQLIQNRGFKGMTKEEEYNMLLPAIEGGTITPFADRKNIFADAIARTGVGKRMAIGGALGAAGGEEDARANGENPFLGLAAGAAAGAGFGKAAPKITRGMNRLTWAIDDASKLAVFRRKVARGMSPDSAAAETMREMIDYEGRSGATQASKKIAPFGTFRTRMPAAVASSTLRNPQRIMALDRASSGIFGGGEAAVPQGESGNPYATARKEFFRDSTPFSDVFEVSDDAGAKYARAMVADPVKAAGTGLADAIILRLNHDAEKTGGRPISPEAERALRYLTYKQPLFPHPDKDGKMKSGFLAGQAAGYIPLNLGQAALSAAGLSEYQAQDALSMLMGTTLGARIR